MFFSPSSVLESLTQRISPWFWKMMKNPSQSPPIAVPTTAVGMQLISRGFLIHSQVLHHLAGAALDHVDIEVPCTAQVVVPSLARGVQSLDIDVVPIFKELCLQVAAQVRADDAVSTVVAEDVCAQGIFLRYQ